MSEKQRIIVDIVADFVCPWCFVGLSSFLYAKEELDQTFEVIPRFRAYQLNPDTPFEGVDRQAYYEKKFPDAAQREIMRARLIESAMTAGADFDRIRFGRGRELRGGGPVEGHQHAGTDVAVETDRRDHRVRHAGSA